MGTLVAMPMLASACESNIAELTRQIQALGNVGFRGQIRREGEVTAFQLNRVQILTVTIPQPIPWSDLENPC